jgi:hypothetical protein
MSIIVTKVYGYGNKKCLRQREKDKGRRTKGEGQREKDKGEHNKGKGANNKGEANKGYKTKVTMDKGKRNGVVTLPPLQAPHPGRDISCRAILICSGRLLLCAQEAKGLEIGIKQ